MDKKYTALGLMSGTSMDGVDASIISSFDGIQFEEEFNSYYEYDKNLFTNLINLRDKIFSSKDLKKLSKELKTLEKEITLFHAKVVLDINQSIKKSTPLPEIIGFHGQTMFHNSKEKISLQLGDGNLLSQLTKTIVIYDFRQNDLRNGGQGAPLTPIFHKSLRNKFWGEKLPLVLINIGGITNATCFHPENKFKKKMFAGDLGPGNCLIDEWIRNNSKKRYDKNGLIAKSGKIDELMLIQALENFKIGFENSMDIKDFDISFVRGLSIEDGAATLTKFTSEIISTNLVELMIKKKFDFNNKHLTNIIICGGGRKNKYLIDLLQQKIKSQIKFNKFQLIDDYSIDGDFIESQAFAFLAIRSYLKMPISFPETTGCNMPISGGKIANNF